jgi:type I restriction enzyme S subunit
MTSPVVKLDELVTILSGFAFDSKFFNEEKGMALIRIRDVVPGVSKTYYDGEYHPNYIVDDGDLLIGMDGEFNIAKWQGGRALLNQRVCRIKADGDTLDNNYLYRFLPIVLKSIEAATPFVTVKHLSAKQIRDIQIPLPSLSEQKRIAAILDKADLLRRKRREAIAKLDSLLQSVFLEMFGDPASNPNGWPERPLSSLVAAGDNINYGVVQPGDTFASGVPIVRVGDMVSGYVNIDGLKCIAPEIEASYRRSRLKGNEVLVSCVGSIGATALATEALKGFNIARAVARIPCSHEINNTFLLAYLRTSHIQKYFKNETRTVSQPTLNIKQIAETIVFCPPVPEQRRFEEYIHKLDSLRVLQQKSDIRINMLFSASQDSLLSGKAASDIQPCLTSDS